MPCLMIFSTVDAFQSVGYAFVSEVFFRTLSTFFLVFAIASSVSITVAFIVLRDI